MDHLRNLLVKIKHRWNILRHSLQSCINYDYDRCLDLIMIGGGIKPLGGPERWKRSCLILYRLLGYYQLIVAFAKVGFGIVDQDDLVGLCFSLMLLISLVKGCANVYVLENSNEAVLQLKTFIRSNTIHSGDPDFDATVRWNAAKIAGKMTMAMILLFCCNQVLILIPSASRDHFLGVPEQLQSLGIMATRVLQAAFLMTLIIFWGCRHYYSSILVLPLLMGLRSELKIVALAYDTIEDRVQAQVLEDQNKVVRASQQLPTNNALKWKHLKQILGTTLEQQLEVLRNIQLVQSIVSFTYAITHYGTMAMVSTLVFLIIRSGASAMTVAMAFASCACIVECYLWCHLVNSIEEVMETMVGPVAQLGTRLEHSLENHSEYIQMRTSVMIILINASRSELFSCGGIFPITIESFGDLCFIIYRFATFLLNFE